MAQDKNTLGIKCFASMSMKRINVYSISNDLVNRFDFMVHVICNDSDECKFSFEQNLDDFCRGPILSMNLVLARLCVRQ